MVSRRALLAGGAAGIVGLGAASRLRLDGVSTTLPSPDTWPLRRFDAAGTAANRDATPPSEPAVAWTANRLPIGLSARLAVGPGRVYAAAVGKAVALARDDGRERWTADGGRPLALRGDTVFAGPGDEASHGSSPAIRALDAASGDVRWTAPTTSEGTTLRVADDLLAFGGEAGLEAFDPSTGRRRWRSDGLQEAVPVVRHGAIYGASAEASADVGRYRSRLVADALTGSPPEPSWLVERGGSTLGAAAAADALVVGFRVNADDPDSSEPCCDPAWVCYEAGDGTVRWRARTPTEGTAAVGPFAVADGRCVAGVRGAGVVARRLTDGGVLWQVPLDDEVRDVVVVGDTVLVGGSFGTVRAHALADGDERWRADVGMTPATLAAVDGAVFVASPAGQVAALR